MSKETFSYAVLLALLLVAMMGAQFVFYSLLKKAITDGINESKLVEKGAKP